MYEKSLIFPSVYVQNICLCSPVMHNYVTTVKCLAFSDVSIGIYIVYLFISAAVEIGSMRKLLDL